MGVKLLYPNDTIQHAGIILGINGEQGKIVAGHAFKFFPREKYEGFPYERYYKKLFCSYSSLSNDR